MQDTRDIELEGLGVADETLEIVIEGDAWDEWDMEEEIGAGRRARVSIPAGARFRVKTPRPISIPAGTRLRTPRGGQFTAPQRQRVRVPAGTVATVPRSGVRPPAGRLPGPPPVMRPLPVMRPRVRVPAGRLPGPLPGIRPRVRPGVPSPAERRRVEERMRILPSPLVPEVTPEVLLPAIPGIPARVGGISTALLVGGLIIGAIVLSKRKK